MQSPKSDQSDVDEVFSPQKDTFDPDQVPQSRSLASDCDYSTPGNTINYAYIQSPSQIQQDELSVNTASSKSGSCKSAGNTPYRFLKNSVIDGYKSVSDDGESFKTAASNPSVRFISGTADNQLCASSTVAKTLESSYAPLSTPEYCNSKDTLTFL